MNGDEFDDDLHDETLSGRLGALAPSEFDIDADAALGSMRPAFHRARARRRLAISGSALGVVAIFVAGAVVVQQQPASRVNIESHAPTSVSTPTTRSRSTTTVTTAPTVVVPPPPEHSTTTVPGSTNTGTGEHPTPTSPNSTPTTPDDHGGSTPSTIAAPSTKTYTSVGGKATIRFANGNLTLVSHTATPGYATEIHTNKPDDIELRFSKGSAESRIRVRVQDGRVQPEITEK